MARTKEPAKRSTAGARRETFILQRRYVAFRKAMPSKARKKKRTTVPAGTPNTTSGGVAQRRSRGKRKANELAKSGD